MRFWNGSKVFIALLAFTGLGVILTLDPSAVIERQRLAAQERSQHYQQQYSSAYAHYMGAESVAAAYDYPAYRRPMTAAEMAASGLSQTLREAPTAAGGLSAEDNVQRQIDLLRLQMYQHANREEYQQAADIQATIRELQP